MNKALLERLERAASNTLSVELKSLFQDAAEAIRGSENYIRVVDEELVCAHLGVAKNTDTYGEAKSKLNKVICWNVDLAKDPAVNGGFILVKQDTTPDNPDDYVMQF